MNPRMFLVPRKVSKKSSSHCLGKAVPVAPSTPASAKFTQPLPGSGYTPQTYQMTGIRKFPNLHSQIFEMSLLNTGIQQRNTFLSSQNN